MQKETQKQVLALPLGDKMGNVSQTLAKRVLELRKQRGWSQPDLAKKIGTSGAIVGRYERGEMTPSVKVANKLANAFGVTVDYMVAESNLPDILGSQDMIERWKSLEALEPKEKEKILSVLDSLIRDANARHAYSKAS